MDTHQIEEMMPLPIPVDKDQRKRYIS